MTVWTCNEPTSHVYVQEKRVFETMNKISSIMFMLLQHMFEVWEWSLEFKKIKHISFYLTTQTGVCVTLLIQMNAHPSWENS